MPRQMTTVRSRTSTRGANRHYRVAHAAGMGLWGYVFLLLGVSVVITLPLRLGPHYLNNNTVVSVINSLASDPVHTMSKRENRELLLKRFKINSLYDLEPAKIIEIKRTKENTQLLLEYEVREPLIHNVDAVLTFKDEFQYR